MSEPRKLNTGSASGGFDQSQYEAARRRAQQRAQRQPHCQANDRHNQIFPKGHPAQGVLVHAQHIIQAELPIAAADEEGIGIQQEDSGEHRNHYFSQ